MEISFKSKFKNRTHFAISGWVKLNFKRQLLWGIITAPQHLENFHPFCQTHSVSEWNGIGSKDTGIFYSGQVMSREVIAWKEGFSYQIKMDAKDVNNIFISFQLEELGKRDTLFKMEISSDAFKNFPRPLWYLFAKFYLVPNYKKYLESIFKGLNYYATTNKKVTRNQFGSHKIYSP